VDALKQSCALRSVGQRRLRELLMR